MPVFDLLTSTESVYLSNMSCPDRVTNRALSCGQVDGQVNFKPEKDRLYVNPVTGLSTGFFTGQVVEPSA